MPRGVGVAGKVEGVGFGKRQPRLPTIGRYGISAKELTEITAGNHPAVLGSTIAQKYLVAGLQFVPFEGIAGIQRLGHRGRSPHAKNEEDIKPLLFHCTFLFGLMDCCYCSFMAAKLKKKEKYQIFLDEKMHFFGKKYPF